MAKLHAFVCGMCFVAAMDAAIEGEWLWFTVIAVFATANGIGALVVDITKSSQR